MALPGMAWHVAGLFSIPKMGSPLPGASRNVASGFSTKCLASERSGKGWLSLYIYIYMRVCLIHDVTYNTWYMDVYLPNSWGWSTPAPWSHAQKLGPSGGSICELAEVLPAAFVWWSLMLLSLCVQPTIWDWNHQLEFHTVSLASIFRIFFGRVTSLSWWRLAFFQCGSQAYKYVDMKLSLSLYIYKYNIRIMWFYLLFYICLYVDN